MKKIICIILVACALLLCACADEKEISKEESASAGSVSTEQSIPEKDVSAEQSVPEVSEETDTSIPEEESEKEPENLYENAHVDESGVFCSNYECGLDIEVRWTMQTQKDDTVIFKADVYLKSYSIKVSARYGNCVLSVNGEKTTFSAPAVNVEDCKKPEYTYLATVQTEVEVSDEVHDYVISVSYPFRGTYNDVSLPVIEAMESFSLDPSGVVIY